MKPSSFVVTILRASRNFLYWRASGEKEFSGSPVK